MKFSLDNEVSLLTNKESAVTTLNDAIKSYNLRTGYLKEHASRTYRLRLWMDENTPTEDAYMSKKLESKITIVANYLENLDNQIIAEATSLNERYGREETFSIHVTSEKYNLVAMSEDLEHWEELEEKGKEVNFERTYTENGTHKYYFMDEVDNVEEVNVEVTKIDDKKPIADIKVLKQDNLITVNAGASIDNETSVVKYYYSRDGENFIESEESVYKFSEYNYGLATKMLTEYLGWKVYVKVEDEVGNISDVKEYTISNTEGSLLYDGTTDNNLRYVGASPNNYVSFNNELWRIIGVMNNIMDADGNLETRVKIRKSDSIGNYAWDDDDRNNWEKSSLNFELNTTYYNGFTSIFKDMVKEVTWNLGGGEKALTARENYLLERNTIVFSGNPITWIGKIGLMYASDYGFATGGNVRSNCLNKNMSSWGLYDYCHTNNYLYDSSGNEYFITHNSASSIHVFVKLLEVSSYSGHINQKLATKPTLYLKPTVKIIGGLGTSSNPFVLSL